MSRFEKIVTTTLESTPKNVTHWTRSLAAHLGVSQDAVWRTWQAFGLQPHRQEKFKLSADPQFGAKVYDIRGLYLNPPERWSYARVVRARILRTLKCAAKECVQCVAFFGVLRRRRHDLLDLLIGNSPGRPGRGSSSKPSRRRSADRLRHLVTVGRETPSCPAIS